MFENVKNGRWKKAKRVYFTSQMLTAGSLIKADRLRFSVFGSSQWKTFIIECKLLHISNAKRVTMSLGWKCASSVWTLSKFTTKTNAAQRTRQPFQLTGIIKVCTNEWGETTAAKLTAESEHFMIISRKIVCIEIFYNPNGTHGVCHSIHLPFLNQTGRTAHPDLRPITMCNVIFLWT